MVLGIEHNVLFLARGSYNLNRITINHLEASSTLLLPYLRHIQYW